MIQATAGQIMGQFAKNLRAHIAASSPATAPVVARGASPVVPSASSIETPPPAAKPISGFSLMAKVLWNAIVRLFKRPNM